MESIWTENTQLPSFVPLAGDIKTDVLIIGGGMAGILCAYMLKKQGTDCILIEQGRLCRGVTGSTTAKITSQHGLIYQKLVKQFGVEGARLYRQANEAALEQYADLCREIACDFERKDNFVYSLDRPDKLEKEMVALAQMGVPAELAQRLPLPLECAGAVCFQNQAQFHPLKFICGILPGLPIYEQTKAKAFLPPNTVITNRGRIRAEKIVVTTHFPMFNKHGAYFLKLYQHRSYVLGLKNGPDVHGMYVDENEMGLSFRNGEGYLLLGGGGHRTGKKGGGWAELEAFARERYPESKISCCWATQDCMSLDGMPYIGQYSKATPELFVATGFNKWGMTSSMVVATVLADLVEGKDNEWAELFSPSRNILRPQLFVNGISSVANLLTPTKPRCPHMGCALKWNAQEHSWDCPCHGSRFGEDGKVLDNPATDDMK